jgi:hypothetical protein
MADRLDADTPVGAYWMDVVNNECSMNEYLHRVEAIEGPEALVALRRGAEDLIHEIDEGQIEEGGL